MFFSSNVEVPVLDSQVELTNLHGWTELTYVPSVVVFILSELTVEIA